MPFELPLDPSVIVLIGKPRSGKSYAVKSLLYQYAKHFSTERKNRGHFAFGLAISKTAFTGAYNYIPEAYVWDSYDEGKLKLYLDSLEALRNFSTKDGKVEDKLQPNFLLIDDMMGLLNTRDSLLVNLITCHRHYKMTIFITSQYMVGNCSTLLRECSTHAFVWPLKAKNSLEATYEAFGFKLENVKQWSTLLEKATSKEHSCLVFVDGHKEISDSYYAFKALPLPDKPFKFKY
jgi:hypothetical protein